MGQELLRMSKINKSFPGVHALADVDFDLYGGEVHALLGENGAGKSTLMNVLSGMLQKDSGEIFIKGEKCEITSSAYAIRNGVGMVPQELNIVPAISVAENIFMGAQICKLGCVIDWKTMNEKAVDIMKQLGLDIPPQKIAGECSVAQLQMVQIARALAFGAEIIILDEPTSCLTYQEKNDLFAVVRQLKETNVGFVFITHHLDEVEELADRVTVMRDGQVVDTVRMEDTSIKEIVEKMAGQKVILNKFSRDFESSDVILEVKNLTRKKEFRDITFDVKRGEIFGMAGLVGAGRTELMTALFGVNPIESGQIFFKGQEVKIHSPKEAINLGIGYLPEERRTQGIFPELSVRENLTISILKRLFKKGKIDFREQRKITDKYIKEFGIKTSSQEKNIRDLSGGNQQKVILARWVERDLDLLILDEPTRGIDVRAKNEIHKMIESLAQQGKTIIVISSEMEELLNITDRIMIMHEGNLKGIVKTSETTQRDILAYALQG